MFHQRLTQTFQRISPYVPHALFGVLAVLLILLAVNDRNFRPLRNKADWKAASNYSQAGAKFAIDRDLETWWSSYYAMTFGMWMQVDVGQPVTLNGIVLRVNKTSKEAQPKEWVVKVSRDGSEWQTARTRDGAVDGTLLLIPFEPVSTRYVQIIQTSIATTPSPWRIYELDLLQPVAPWQCARSTLISLIIGWLWVMIPVLLFKLRPLALPLRSQFAFSEPSLPVGALFITLMLAAVMLAGWGFSVYHAEGDELSAGEFSLFERLAFESHSTSEWIRAYFHHVESGASWLTLLSIRFAHRFCQSQLAAYRFVPAMFGVGSMLSLFLIWRAISRSRAVIWEALAAAAMFGLAGWTILLHRSGDFSSVMLFWALIELALSYRLLHGRFSVAAFLVFALVSALGVCFHPALRLLPVGVLAFELFDLWRGVFAPNWLPSPSLQPYRLRDHLRKIAWHLAALLPMFAYWRLVMGNLPLRVQFDLHEYAEALRASGLSGVAGMVFFSFATLGLIYMLSERSHGEWFFMISGGVFAVVLSLVSPDDHRAASLLLLLLFALLCAKGCVSVLAFLTPRQTERRQQRLHGMALLLFAGYMSIATVNALFLGTARLPGDPQTFAKQQARRQFQGLTEAIHADPDDCKTMAAFTERDQNMLASLYRLPVGVAHFKELRRLSEQGIFISYLFADAVSATHPEVAGFLQTYYDHLGASTLLSAYHLREEFRRQPQRFYPEELFHNTGRSIQDAAASRGIARLATTADTPGLLSFGPFCRVCQPGRYIARFALQAGEPVDKVVATLLVVEGSAELPGRRPLTGRELSPAGTYHLIEIPFTVDFSDAPAYRMKRYQFFTETTAAADVRLNYIELKRAMP